MAEYIEREKVLKAVCLWCAGNVDIDDDEPCCCAEMEEILNIPIADVVEVKHGYWVRCKNNSGYKCSNCGSRIKNSDKLNGNHVWCHKCGAKMDLEGALDESV